MEGKEELFTDIRNGHLKAIQEKIDANPDWLNSTDSRGSTPLLLATYYGHLEVAEYLLSKGAAVDATDSSGNTALMGVCFKGYEAIARLLVKAGADVNHVNSMGATSLIYAATFNKVGIAKILLEHGADSKVKDGRGNSALDNAKMQEAKEMVELLEAYS
jgi:ankyrin repeat protein